MSRRKQRQLRLFPIGTLGESGGEIGPPCEGVGEPDPEEWESIMEELGRLLADGPFRVSKGGLGRSGQERFRGY